MGIDAVWLVAPVMAKKEIETILEGPMVCLSSVLSRSVIRTNLAEMKENLSVRF